MDQIKTGRFNAELRKEKKLSQAQLGERIGVTNKTVSRWENGNYLPDISTLQVLCRELDITVNELLSGCRLPDESFRSQADANIIHSMAEHKRLMRQKHIISFLEGGGTGLLISVFFSPDSVRKTVIAVAAVAMIISGWIYRRKLSF